MADLIDRQAAIDSICRTVCDNPEICESPCDEIKVLRLMPSAQPETHEERTETHACDCIERQAVLDWLKNEWNGKVTSLFDGIKGLPSAHPETAKRIVGKSRDGMTLWYQCDMCNEPVDVQDNFCRGCGRRLTDE